MRPRFRAQRAGRRRLLEEVPAKDTRNALPWRGLRLLYKVACRRDRAVKKKIKKKERWVPLGMSQTNPGSIGVGLCFFFFFFEFFQVPNRNTTGNGVVKVIVARP